MMLKMLAGKYVNFIFQRQLSHTTDLVTDPSCIVLILFFICSRCAQVAERSLFFSCKYCCLSCQHLRDLLFFNVLIVLVDQGTKHVLLFQKNTEKETLRELLWSIKQECLPNGVAGSLSKSEYVSPLII